MKVKITNKTESVLTLNKSNVILRGKVSGIFDLDTDEKINEIKELHKNNLVDLERLDIKEAVKKEEIPEKTEIPEKAATVKSGKKRGRPPKKGSKEAKAVKRVGAGTKENPTVVGRPPVPVSGENMKSSVVVMAGAKPVKTQTMRSYAGEIEESEKTAASLRAMRELEAEERSNNRWEARKDYEDQSKLDPSERSGGKAVIGGGGGSSKVKMKNSAIEGAKEIKDKSPFLSGYSPEESEKEGVDPFIEKNEKNEEDGEDPDFIEM